MQQGYRAYLITQNILLLVSQKLALMNEQFLPLPQGHYFLAVLGFELRVLCL
jgi:hypothetical protein